MWSAPKFIQKLEGVTEAVNTKIYVQVLMEAVEKVSSMDVFNQGDESVMK